MKCPETITIGAYVLGAVDSADRYAIEEHLRTCKRCREALLQFAPLPGLLHAVPLEDLEYDERAPLPLPERPVRRTRRWILAAVATVAVAAGGLVSWYALDSAESTTWTATNGVGGIDTTAQLTNRGWGTDIRLRMTGLRHGEDCELLVHSRDGSVEVAGWWASNDADRADVPASTSIPLQDIERLDVVTAGDTVLSTVTPATQ